MIKCKIKIDRIMFPKGKEIETGEYVIFTGKMIEHISGDLPKINKIFKTISFKGVMPHIRVGDVFTLKFFEVETNNYGTTYSVDSTVMEINKGIKSELEGYFKVMCGNKIAKEMMKIEGAYDLLTSKNDEELLKINGIGEKRLEQIYSNMNTYSDNSYAIAKLEPLGLSRNIISKICLALGGAGNAVEVCTKKPYSLIKLVKGVGFIMADQVALKCGHSFYSPQRIEFAILHVLEISGESGKSYLTAPQLLVELRKIVDIEFSILDGIISKLIESEEVVVSGDGTRVALKYYYELESKILAELIRIRDAKQEIQIPEDWREKVKAIEESQGWDYTEEQMIGIEEGFKNNIVVYTGKAGSGKSTITNAICSILDHYDIVMCCLSAKASQRLTEVTGREASTIHRLLGIGTGREDCEVYADVVILDEASMVSGTIFLKLLTAIRNGTKLFILGDDGQLTAIGDCAVFADLLSNNIVRVIELTEIHRQAKKSAIITKSIEIRNQKQIYERSFRGHKILGELQDLELFVENTSDNMAELVKKKFIEDLRITGSVLEVQVITALKSNGALSTKNLNEILQDIYVTKTNKFIAGYKDVKIYVGDKIINTKNNYTSKSTEKRTTPVFNGSIGIVKEINDTNVIVDFVGIGEIVINSGNYKALNLAYAITCHSSQGSQWKRVICVFDMSGYVLLNVEILYTGLTRAELHGSLIIEHSAMQHILSTVEQKNKQTFLSLIN